MIKLINLAPQHLTYEVDNEDFRTFAIQKHGFQKYGELPYAWHLAMVENCLSNAGYRLYKDRATAWLHDVVEDTDTTLEQVNKFFGPEITSYVDACTGVGENRKERNAAIYRKLNETPLAAPYKVADRICNVKVGVVTRNPKAMMYVKEHGVFSEAVRPLMMGDTRSSVFWSDLDTVIDQAQALFRRGELAA